MKTTKEKISTFKLTFDAAEVKSLWQCFHKDGENEITETEMLSFHSGLNMHIEASLGLKVDQLDLKEVTLPFVSLSAGGKIRIQDEAHVKLILRHLTAIYP
ncbi:uncharacterized protein LOC111714998 isoform X2 [Eurytemora carolleeae]|uniref:uncharacterized protein LOC111714998 isoform X2 n=1 Tax=Eurytemora carolleeae TaxID=1294199 RepID=UPI000C75B2BE|nr:uncharacterized protein LOC111714998 isoform X2 [Eurytemora carolleeae]|eukprot:XP_023345996.1 uncharacterized protein LOC111714998 isoform X2 [Eurytemora affinis]